MTKNEPTVGEVNGRRSWAEEFSGLGRSRSSWLAACEASNAAALAACEASNAALAVGSFALFDVKQKEGSERSSVARMAGRPSPL